MHDKQGNIFLSTRWIKFGKLEIHQSVDISNTSAHEKNTEICIKLRSICLIVKIMICLFVCTYYMKSKISFRISRGNIFYIVQMFYDTKVNHPVFKG